MPDGRVLALEGAAGKCTGRRERVVRVAVAAWLTLALLFIGFSLGRASAHDETSLTAQVTSADHEQEEGYFSLGENATLVAKPGTDLFRFLTRQRGHKVKIVLQESTGPELSRLDRDRE
jgi:hypothetical protein